MASAAFAAPFFYLRTGDLASLLPDPDCLLGGEGKLIRHVRIAQAADQEAAGLRELVRAAIVQGDRPEGRGGSPRTVVRTAQATGEALSSKSAAILISAAAFALVAPPFQMRLCAPCRDYSAKQVCWRSE